MGDNRVADQLPDCINISQVSERALIKTDALRMTNSQIIRPSGVVCAFQCRQMLGRVKSKGGRIIAAGSVIIMLCFFIFFFNGTKVVVL